MGRPHDDPGVAILNDKLLGESIRAEDLAAAAKADQIHMEVVAEVQRLLPRLSHRCRVDRRAYAGIAEIKLVEFEKVLEKNIFFSSPDEMDV